MGMKRKSKKRKKKESLFDHREWTTADNNYRKLFHFFLHFNILIASLLFFNCFFSILCSVCHSVFSGLMRIVVVVVRCHAQEVNRRTSRSLKIIYLCFVHEKRKFRANACLTDVYTHTTWYEIVPRSSLLNGKKNHWNRFREMRLYRIGGSLNLSFVISRAFSFELHHT